MPGVGVRPGVGRGGQVSHGFRGRGFNSFSPDERVRWEGGNWHNDWHDGRFGWWWQVDDGWYWYPEPVYPFPTDVAAVADEGDLAAPLAGPLGQPPAQFWYFCDATQAFYPYVAVCPTGWRQVAPGTPQ
jgi:hypothetical protein